MTKNLTISEGMRKAGAEVLKELYPNVNWRVRRDTAESVFQAMTRAEIAETDKRYDLVSG